MAGRSGSTPARAPCPGSPAPWISIASTARRCRRRCSCPDRSTSTNTSSRAPVPPARLEDAVVITSSAHCATEGMTAWEPDGRTVRGVFGPAALLEPCPYERHTCRPSDMNYLVMAPDRIPWGRLNVVDMGEGGERVIEPGAAPLSCSDIKVGDEVE